MDLHQTYVGPNIVQLIAKTNWLRGLAPFGWLYFWKSWLTFSFKSFLFIYSNCYILEFKKCLQIIKLVKLSYIMHESKKGISDKWWWLIFTKQINSQNKEIYTSKNCAKSATKRRLALFVQLSFSDANMKLNSKITLRQWSWWK